MGLVNATPCCDGSTLWCLGPMVKDSVGLNKVHGGMLVCGRFSLGMTVTEVQQAFPFMLKDSATLGAWNPRYNVAPGTDVLVVVERHQMRWGGLVRWGWPLRWQPGHQMINARVETIASKPWFRGADRAIVVADSYYEWHPTTKQPFRICEESGQVLTLAALILRTPSPPESRVVIVTEAASGDMKAIHHRAPRLLSGAAIDAWYAGEDVVNGQPSAVRTRAIPISTMVNNVRADGPDLHVPYPG